MGAYAPAPIVTPEVEARVMREIVGPVLAGMAAEGAPFRGVLFVGLMIDQGVPSVIEYNVRFGDPETTVLVPMYDGDWFSLLDGAARGDLSRVSARTRARGGHRRRDGGRGISGQAEDGGPHRRARRRPSRRRLRAPRRDFAPRRRTVVTSGGRVLAVGARAETLEAAARVAYDAVGRIRWRGEHHRSDVGHRALAKGR